MDHFPSYKFFHKEFQNAMLYVWWQVVGQLDITGRDELSFGFEGHGFWPAYILPHAFGAVFPVIFPGNQFNYGICQNISDMITIHVASTIKSLGICCRSQINVTWMRSISMVGTSPKSGEMISMLSNDHQDARPFFCWCWCILTEANSSWPACIIESCVLHVHPGWW